MYPNVVKIKRAEPDAWIYSLFQYRFFHHDPRTIGEAIYFARPRENTYTRMDGSLYQQIVSGALRLSGR
jgi:hypothetical protein